MTPFCGKPGCICPSPSVELEDLRAQLADAQEKNAKYVGIATNNLKLKTDLAAAQQRNAGLADEIAATKGEVRRLREEKHSALKNTAAAQDEIKREHALHNSMAESRAIYAAELDKVTGLLRDLIWAADTRWSKAEQNKFDASIKATRDYLKPPDAKI